MRKVIRLILVFVAAVIVFFVVRHLLQTDRDRIQAVIDKGIAAIESDSPLIVQTRLMDCLSDNYRHRGERVGMTIDRAVASQYLLGIKQSGYSDFQVEVKTLRIEITEDTARAEITGRITASNAANPGERTEVLTDGGRHKAVLEFRKEEEGWRIVSSERQALPLE